MPHAETSVIWCCDVCSTGHTTEAEALECEKLPLERGPFEIGDQFTNPGYIWVWVDSGKGYGLVPGPVNERPPIFTIAGSRVVLQKYRKGKVTHAIEHHLVSDTHEPVYKRGQALRNWWIWVNPIKESPDFRKPNDLEPEKWKWALENLVKERESRAEMPEIPSYRGPSPLERFLRAVFGEDIRIKDEYKR